MTGLSEHIAWAECQSVRPPQTHGETQQTNTFPIPSTDQPTTMSFPAMAEFIRIVCI